MADPLQSFRAVLVAHLGHAPEHIEPGRLVRFPTNGKRGDTSGWCKLFDDGRAGVFGDFRTGLAETWTAIARQAMTPAERAELARQVLRARAEREAQQRQQWARNAQHLTKLWGECRPLVPGDAATLYLKGRGFGGVWPLPACLRFHPALRYRHDDGSTTTHPGMVAPLMGAGGELLALHRTYLTRDGRKAQVPTVKKLTPAAGLLAGACIRLAEPARGVLGIAEGIETALAAWCASGLPVAAAYSASNLTAWRWPSAVQRVVIFGDQDEAGRKAAQALRDRVRAAGLSCNVMTPNDEGADWCDVWAQRGAVEVRA